MIIRSSRGLPQEYVSVLVIDVNRAIIRFRDAVHGDISFTHFRNHEHHTTDGARSLTSPGLFWNYFYPRHHAQLRGDRLISKISELFHNRIEETSSICRIILEFSRVGETDSA